MVAILTIIVVLLAAWVLWLHQLSDYRDEQVSQLMDAYKELRRKVEGGP